MKIKITQHCNERMDERGRQTADVRVILKYGSRHVSGRHRQKCLMTRRRVNNAIRRLRGWLARHSSPQFRKRAQQARDLIRLLERAANWMLVIVEGKAAVRVITVHLTRASQRRKLAGGVAAAKQG